MKRIALKLALFLLVGATFNLAVAWGFATLPSPWRATQSGTKSLGFQKVWCLARFEQAGLRFTESGFWQMVPMDDSGTSPRELIGRESRVTDVEAKRPNVLGGQMEWEVLSGWPMLCMGGLKRNEFHFGTNNFEFLESAILLEPSLAGRPFVSSLAYRQKLLPLRPIWPGFAINTIFYAAILWLPFAAFGRVRRWHRLKRGLCPACGYPVGTSAVCTECGRPTSLRSG